MQQKSTVLPKIILPIIVLCLIILVVVGLIFAIGILPLRSNAGLIKGMQIIKNDPTVADMFGSPIHQGLNVMGKLQGFRDGSGVGTMTTSISGPKGKAEANFFISKPRGGDWQLESMSIDQDWEIVLIWDSDKSEMGFRYRESPPTTTDLPKQPVTATPPK